MFKEVLRKDKVYDIKRDRIMCRIGSKDVEINQSRKFKAAALSMYERGQDPISFMVETFTTGEYVYPDLSSCVPNILKGRPLRIKKGVGKSKEKSNAA